VHILRDKGPVYLLRFFWIKAYDLYWQRRLRTRTEGVRFLRDLGVRDSDCYDYWPCYYWELTHALSLLKVEPEKEVFLDLGSGTGKVAIMAATMPFRKVIGVELCDELNRAAAANLSTASRLLACRDVELITGDATQYRIPREVTIISLFNPFGGSVLAQVMENIRDSVAKNPRRVMILYINIARCRDQIAKCTWFVKRHGFVGVYENAIYEVVL
jgi:precorrin-6B methylase 2